MNPRYPAYALLGAMALNHDGQDHPHNDWGPPQRQCIFQNCLTAASTTTTPNPADRLGRMSGCNE